MFGGLLSGAEFTAREIFHIAACNPGRLIPSTAAPEAQG